MPRPTPGTYFSYFDNYISKVPETDIKEAFKNQQELIDTYFDTIREEKSDYAYAQGKWTLKELLQHVIDTERIFSYRAIAIARKEKAPLPGFDENEYAENSDANKRSWKSLTDELKAVRKSTKLLFESFTDETLGNSGIASNNPITVNALGFTLVGHLYHHKKVIEERYNQDPD
ncbi:MAG TPA: DinB family protein [Ferruginibacter sp.]|nr:DinB family protein [Ferruginibacter sp.]